MNDYPNGIYYSILVETINKELTMQTGSATAYTYKNR